MKLRARAAAVNLWTSPVDRRAPVGACGQPVDNALGRVVIDRAFRRALPTGCPHSRTSRPQPHSFSNKIFFSKKREGPNRKKGTFLLCVDSGMAHQYTPSLIGYVSEFRSQLREQSRPIMERKRFRANAGRARTLGAALIVAGTSMACGVVAAGELYVRAGVGLDRPAETRFMDRDCSSTSPAALCGCGRGEDGTPHRSLGNFGTVNALEMGVGRKNPIRWNFGQAFATARC